MGQEGRQEMTKKEVIEKAKEVGAYSLIIKLLNKEEYTEEEVKKIFAAAGIRHLYCNK